MNGRVKDGLHHARKPGRYSIGVKQLQIKPKTHALNFGGLKRETHVAPQINNPFME
jgi:hypothetical protein